MSGKAETIGGAAVAALIGMVTALVALLSQDGVSSLGDISQAAWIVLTAGGLASFGKDYQALSYRRWQAAATGSSNVHLHWATVLITASIVFGFLR